MRGSGAQPIGQERTAAQLDQFAEEDEAEGGHHGAEEGRQHPGAEEDVQLE